MLDKKSRKVRHVGAPDAAEAAAAAAEEFLHDAPEPSEQARRAADEAYERQRARERRARRPEAADDPDADMPTVEELMPPQAGRKKRKKPGRVKRIILFSLLGLLAVAGILVGKFIYDINNPAPLFQQDYTPIPAPPTPTPVETQQSAGIVGEATPAPTPTPDPEAGLLSVADMEFMKNRVNVLVLGLDESTERANWGSFRTDTMILVTIDFDTNDVDLISVPRDSYVKICNGSASPTGKYGKINSAFPSGGGAQKNGYQYAMGTVSYLFGGIPISYYVGFNMNVVKDVVNAMGGVYYDVDIEVKMNGRELHPGMQFMDGQAVLDYCRQRKGSSDVARVERQQNMLKAIFRQMKSSGQVFNLVSIYQAVEQNIQTNLNLSQIGALALLASRMDMNQLGNHVVDGEFMNLSSTSYWGLHTGKLEAMLKEVYGVSVRVDSEVSASNVRAQVEAQRALIAAELNAASAAIRQADAILSQYGSYLDANTRASLEAAKSQLEDAVDAEDKELLDYYTPPVQRLNSSILAQLGVGGVQQPSQPTPTPQDQYPFPTNPTPEQQLGGNTGGMPEIPIVG